MNGLISEGTVVPSWQGSETWKLFIKEVGKGQVTTLKRISGMTISIFPRPQASEFPVPLKAK